MFDWRLRTRAALLVLVLGAGLGASAAEVRLRPVDEGSGDPSFQAFRRRLIAALRRDDRHYVFSIVDPKLTPGFGDPESGLAGLKEEWPLDEPGGGRWIELRETLLVLLAMGGSFRDGGFWAPYIFSEWPQELDAFGYSAIIGRGVALRSKPDGPVLRRLTYDIVKVPEQKEGPDGGWFKVVTLDGREGYVAKRYVRSPMDYRAGFKKQKGRWRLTALVAGD